MLQALINFFKPYKQEPVQVKIEDTVKVEAPAPEPVTVVKAETPTPKAPAKGKPKVNKPAENKAPGKTRKKK